MVIDTSAIITILRGEPAADRFQQSIAAAPQRRLSAATLLECRIVAANLGIASELDAWLAAAAIMIEPFTADQCRLAEGGFLAFGKGRHPAGLNFGDCFAYALAKQTGEPLLSFWLPRSCVGARAGAPRPAPRPDAERPPGIPTRSVGTEYRGQTTASC